MPSKAIYLFKETAEFIRRLILRKISFSKDVDKLILSELSRDGIVSIPNYISSEECAELCSIIDDYLVKPALFEKIWVDKDKSDHRIFGIEKIDKTFSFMLDDPFIIEIQKSYTGRKNSDKTVLGAKLTAALNNQGSGGGWHRDSPYSTQFKSILFLSDVTSNNGPFQYIKHSHKAFTLIDEIMNGHIKPSQYRFSDSEVENLRIYKEYFHECTANAGTLIMVDVKGIHRGAPINMGSRYALTAYYGDPKLKL